MSNFGGAYDCDQFHIILGLSLKLRMRQLRKQNKKEEVQKEATNLKAVAAFGFLPHHVQHAVHQLRA